VQIDDEGADAVCDLGRGDMRQTLNILQSVVMAHGEVTLDNAYLCTGNPTPSTIEAIVHCLLSKDMSASFKELHTMQVPLLCTTNP
jgi:replication factor C subunit 3/5